MCKNTNELKNVSKLHVTASWVKYRLSYISDRLVPYLPTNQPHLNIPAPALNYCGTRGEDYGYIDGFCLGYMGLGHHCMHIPSPPVG